MSRRTRLSVLVGLLFLVVVGPWVKELSAQPGARLALTGALADEGTIRIDDYAAIVDFDRVEIDGRLYSDKAPGQPFYAVPFYALSQAVGAEPAETFRIEGNLTLWWVTLWSSAIPGAVLAATVAHLCLKDREDGLVGVLAIMFGSLLLPLSAELYGHVMATALAVGGWALVHDRPAGWRRPALAGLLLGLSVLVEYPMVVAAAIVALFVLIRMGGRPASVLVAAAAPSAFALLAYQAAAFGSPFSSSYDKKPIHDEGGTAIVGLPKPLQALEILFGTRGLVWFTPIVVIGVLGLIRLARRADEPRRDQAIVALAIFGAYYLLQAGWPNAWGGDAPGPRYMLSGFPLLALGIPAILGSLRVFGRGAAIWSAVVMGLPLITYHLVPTGGALFGQHVDYLRDDGLSPTIWSMAFGWGGWVVYAATIVGAAALLWRARPPGPLVPAPEG